MRDGSLNSAYDHYVSRPYRYCLIALLLFSMTVTGWDFVESIRQSTVVGADYDRLGSVLWFASLATLAISYEVHTIRRLRTGETSPEPKKRWRQRVFLRAFLYCFAIMVASNAPLAVIKAEQRAHRPLFPSTFWDEFSWEDFVIPPIVATAIIIYDRRRFRREDREIGNLCLHCGYDLRATPTRCPECGSPVTMTSLHTP